MRGQVLLVALLGSAPGHSSPPPARLGARWPQPAPALSAPAFLAPSPYQPELEPNPFDPIVPLAPRAPPPQRPLRVPQAPVAPEPARLAPSPYALVLFPNPYESHPSPPGAVASTRLAWAAVPNPLDLAPSPYERRSRGELAPSPY